MIEQGKPEIRVDGEQIDGNVIPDFRGQKVHEIVPGERLCSVDDRSRQLLLDL